MSDKRNTYYAHSHADESAPGARWQPLADHLRGVAELARRFAKEARPIDNGDLPEVQAEKESFHDAAYWAGLLHDLGKYRTEFQEYLTNQRPASQETHHAVYGAAAAAGPLNSTPLTFAVAGHHAGLHDVEALQNMMRRYRAVETYQKPYEIWRTELQENLPSNESETDDPARLNMALQARKDSRQGLDSRQVLLPVELLTRMVFSALVDADRCNTAEFEQGELPRLSQFDKELLSNCIDRLSAHVDTLAGDPGDLTLAELRGNIFQHACETGGESPGFFSLTVPTGGGKTLASLAFALHHAKAHEMRRIIFVIPFLSIIEQNADVYRGILGEEIVLEHHSAVRVPEEEQEDESPRRSALELSSENWGMPVIITTSVQFLESLFARSPSKCRKLHNVARSVIVFDETQTLPGGLLSPTINVLRELVASYGISVLFCSATQPGFRRTSNFRDGFEPNEVCEIAPNPPNLFRRLRRVRYHFPNEGEKTSWDALADRLMEHKQVLAIVNTRQDAFHLWQALRARDSAEPGDTFHLSSAMCPEHRMDVLGKRSGPGPRSIYHRLKQGLPCRVVSTQVIESGVDIDFPVVFRAMGPLDGIIQASGRCNREGRLPDLGDVYIFRPSDGRLPPGVYRTATAVSATLIAGDVADRLGMDPALFARYFDQLYGNLLPTDRVQIGKPTIQQMRCVLDFASVAKAVMVIPDNTTSVVAPYGRANDLIAEVCRRRTLRQTDLRRLQRFMVNIRGHREDAQPSDFQSLMRFGMLREIAPGMQLFSIDPQCYDDHLGVVINQRPAKDFVV